MPSGPLVAQCYVAFIPLNAASLRQLSPMALQNVGDGKGCLQVMDIQKAEPGQFDLGMWQSMAAYQNLDDITIMLDIICIGTQQVVSGCLQVHHDFLQTLREGAHYIVADCPTTNDPIVQGRASKEDIKK